MYTTYRPIGRFDWALLNPQPLPPRDLQPLAPNFARSIW
jgi:hypothetical protein